MKIDKGACGPAWWPLKVRKLLTPARFAICCMQHDGKPNESGYADRNTPRALSDKSFRRCLLCAAWNDFIDEHGVTHPGNVWWEIAAIIMGYGVTLFGWAFKKPREWPWKRWLPVRALLVLAVVVIVYTILFR